MKYYFVNFCMVLIVGPSLISSQYSEPESKGVVNIDSSAQWIAHIMDFVELVDINALSSAIFQNMNDPEVVNFVIFLLGPDFKKLVWELESIPEFKEAASFLSAKGYDVEKILDEFNSLLKLPPYEKPTRAGTGGVNGLIEDLLNALPIEEMKKLFQFKIENSSEFAKLFNDLSSKEFLEILGRLSKNPKMAELKKTIESYGFDFKKLCALSQGLLGDYYDGMIC